MDFVFAALPSIICAATLGIVGFVGRKVLAFIKDFKEQHKILMESQRNQLKASVVGTYEGACEKGFISPMDLETVNREYDSYKALGGNHYVHALIRHMNEMEIRGQEIPTE